MLFCRHRDTPESVMPLLPETIERHILDHGVTACYVGHYGAFDRMVAAALAQMKRRYPHITAHLVLAYYPAMRRIQTPEGLDGAGAVFLEGRYTANFFILPSIFSPNLDTPQCQ